MTSRARPTPPRTGHEADIAYARRLGIRVRTKLKLVERIDEGFSYRAFERLQEILGLPAHELGSLLGISPRTLSRRKTQGRLLPEESDRMLRVSRLFDRAVTLFENDEEAARHWLNRPNRGLAERTPLEFSRTEVGAREVEALIGRLEYGLVA